MEFKRSAKYILWSMSLFRKLSVGINPALLSHSAQRSSKYSVVSSQSAVSGNLRVSQPAIKFMSWSINAGWLQLPFKQQIYLGTVVALPSRSQCECPHHLGSSTYNQESSWLSTDLGLLQELQSIRSLKHLIRQTNKLSFHRDQEQPLSLLQSQLPARIPMEHLLGYRR